MKHYKICIVSADNQPQFLGGIKRVVSMLAKEWIEQSLADACFLTACTSSLRKKAVNGVPQFFLPDPENILSSENIRFFTNFVKERNVTIILNPHVEERALTELVAAVRQYTGVKVVSALHFSPTHVVDIVRCSFFNRYLLGYNPVKWMKDFLMWVRFRLYRKSAIEQKEKRWQEKVLAFSDRFVLLSDRFIPIMETKSPEKIVAINNPIDLSLSKQKQKDNAVVWCGRMDVNGAKRVDRMLRIWKRIHPCFPTWKLRILGSGNIEMIKELIRSHKIGNVDVVGFCDPFDFYAEASIVCMTSSTEGWGMVLIEGQSCGCIPVAFDSYASVGDVIKHEKNGILVPAFNEKKYADVLYRLMGNASMRKELSQNALHFVRKFDKSKIAKDWIKLFDEL